MLPSQNDKQDGEIDKSKNGIQPLNESHDSSNEYMKRVSVSQWASRSSDMYEKIYQVGEGTFGKVYKAKIKSVPGDKNISVGEHVALKRILMDNEKEGFPITAIREIMILKRLHHQNIINLIEIVTSKPSEKNKNRGNVYLVFEYMEHDLQGLGDIKINFTSSQIKCILHQVLTGVNYMHTNNIIHRDIKGANILINNKGEVKIADFGLARIHNPNPNVNKQYTNRVVTLWYRSPELLLGSTNYGPSVDIWSVGCLFSELLEGTPPFRANKENEQIQKIFEKTGSPTEETWPGVTKLKFYSSLIPKNIYPNTLRVYYQENKKVTEAAFDLLSRMLELDPSKRITAEEALRHPFFQEEPQKCDPKDLPKIEKDSHEFQSRQNKKQMQGRPIQPTNNAPADMIVARQPYNNPNYYNKSSNEARFKLEDTKGVIQTTSLINNQHTSIGFGFSNSRLESLIPSSQQEKESSLLSNKRPADSSLESDANLKKQKLSPNK